MELKCPVCGSKVPVDDKLEGERVVCPVCGTELVLKYSKKWYLSLPDVEFEGKEEVSFPEAEEE